MLTRGIPSLAGSGGGGGSSDHGTLSGLSDDDHPQYLLRVDIIADVISGMVTNAGNVTTDGGDVVFEPT